MMVLRSLIAAVAIAGSLLSLPAYAQGPPNCEVTTVTDPERQVFSCAFGVSIEMEAAAQMGFAGTDLGAPDVIDLENGAILIDVEPGKARPQIRTPHAIAAVRGTVYVVEVTAEKTSVFVLRGEVAVSQLEDGSTPVLLGAGDGVVVGEEAARTVQQWPETRVDVLLARFGR